MNGMGVPLKVDNFCLVVYLHIIRRRNISNCNTRVEVRDYYLDERSLGTGRNEAGVWSADYIKDLSGWRVCA